MPALDKSEIYLKIKKYLLKHRLISIFIALCFLLYLCIPKPALLEDVDFSKVFYDKSGNLLRLTTSSDEKYRIYAPLKDISPHLTRATLLYEDRYFYYHPGVNPISLIRAFYETYVVKTGKIGASTITMQLARLKFDINSHRVSGKLLQILRAFQLERHYCKEQILEAYLNLAPYGGNIEGVKAASLIYYRQKPSEIGFIKSLNLAVVPQDPVNLNPLNTGNNKKLEKVRQFLFNECIKKNPELEGKKELLSLPSTVYRVQELPFIAPHLTTDLIQRGIYQEVINTTIDMDLQKLLDKSIKDYIEINSACNIHNASAMLVDFNNMEVKALVGSAGFFNNAINGQVNGTKAKRSPGSALKPFIYALALEQGIIHPMSLLKDIPSSFGEYNPENFDEDFQGPVNATDALVSSRNIPAIYLASQLKNPGFYDFLKDAGIKNLKTEKDYGLSLVLGGAEITMEELVSLYTMLANHGELKPFKFIKQETYLREKTINLLSAEAAFLTLDMLKNNNINNRMLYKGSEDQSLPVYWKTGTSNSYRDAWAAGIFGNYVLCVWIGNFDGTPNPAFTGSDAAASLFFNIVEVIKSKENLKDQIQRKSVKFNLKKLDVCTETGDLNTKYCSSKTSSWFIPGKSPIKDSNIYRRILIDRKTGKRACVFNPQTTEYKVYEFWSSDLLEAFDKAGIAKQLPPPFLRECNKPEKMSSGKTILTITSPKSEIEYVFKLSDKKPQKIPLTAISSSGMSTLYWFVNKKLIGQTESNKPLFWTLKPGIFLISVVDNEARSDSKTIRVTLAE